MPELRPIIHIGYHKTASSWFQRYIYPHSSTHRFIDRVLVRNTFVGSGAFDFDPTAAREAIGFDQSGKPPVICEEDLSGYLHGGFAATYVAKEVANRLHATAPEARIVIFVRAQPTAAASHYHQYLREGGTAGVTSYFFPESFRHLGRSRSFKFPHFRFAQLDYRGLVEHYDRLFGRENVHVFAYERLSRDRNALLRDMKTKLGIDFDEPPVAGRRVNESYRAGLIPIARVLNLFTNRSVAYKATLIHIPYWYAARKFLLKQLNRLPIFGRPPAPERLLGSETVEWMRGRFWRNNRWLADRLELDLEALGYPLSGPESPLPRRRRSSLLAWMRH
jgi:hypothetical protein